MTDHADSAADSPVAAAIALLVLPIAIYLSFWVIDWGTTSVVVQAAFCVVVPSLVGSVSVWLGRALRTSRRSAPRDLGRR